MKLPVFQGSAIQILTLPHTRKSLIRFIALFQMKFIQIKVLLNFTFCTYVDHKCRWYYGQNWVAWSASYDFISFLLERWEIITNSWSTGRQAFSGGNMSSLFLLGSSIAFPFFFCWVPGRAECCELRLSLINAEMRAMQTGCSQDAPHPMRSPDPQGSWQAGGSLQCFTSCSTGVLPSILRSYKSPLRVLYVNMLPTDHAWGWKVLHRGISTVSLLESFWPLWYFCWLTCMGKTPFISKSIASHGKTSWLYQRTWLIIGLETDWLVHERLWRSWDLDGGAGSLLFFVSTARSRVSQLMPLQRSREEALKHPLWSLQGSWEPSESSEQRHPLGPDCFPSLERSITQFPHSF